MQFSIIEWSILIFQKILFGPEWDKILAFWEPTGLLGYFALNSGLIGNKCIQYILT